MSMWVREKGVGGREGGRERESGGGGGGRGFNVDEIAYICTRVCLSVCACARARARVCVCMYVCVRARARVCVCGGEVRERGGG